MMSTYLDLREDSHGDLVDIGYYCSASCAPADVVAQGSWPCPDWPDYAVYCEGCGDRLHPSDDALAEQAEKIGREHGRNAAGWWEQDAIGGRAYGDVKRDARIFLQGIEDGDPAIYDHIPAPDLSGEWADGYTPRQLAEDLGLGADDPLLDSFCDSYDQGFSQGCEDEIVRLCRLVLGD